MEGTIKYKIKNSYRLFLPHISLLREDSVTNHFDNDFIVTYKKEHWLIA